ncbi:MAG: hypothetical protein FJ011_14940 [Chloroflexi bacterium]|nr:hypothetical protein [Chloroflexota bacterium]
MLWLLWRSLSGLEIPPGQPAELRIAQTGGIEAMGFQCGQLWGATLAAGALAHRLYGPGPLQ